VRRFLDRLASMASPLVFVVAVVAGSDGLKWG
jgi:hypothetical protein